MEASSSNGRPFRRYFSESLCLDWLVATLDLPQKIFFICGYAYKPWVYAMEEQIMIYIYFLKQF